MKSTYTEFMHNWRLPRLTLQDRAVSRAYHTGSEQGAAVVGVENAD